MRISFYTAVLLVFSSATFAAEIREFDLKTTERLGNELVTVSRRSDRGFSTPARKRARDSAKAALEGKLYDEVRYDYVVLDDPAGSGLLVYALAVPKRKGDVITGGHYRVTVSADGNVVRHAELLSQLVQQPRSTAGKELAALVSSQIEGKSVPVETWIYSSYFYHLPMFVVVVKNRSNWSIANGRIARIKD